MKKKICLLILGMMFFISMSSIVSAQPPFQAFEITSRGVDVNTPVLEIHINGEDYDFHSHPYNASDGLILTVNETGNITCSLDLYNPINGSHKWVAEMEFDSLHEYKEFHYTIKGGNFTRNGEYVIIFECETYLETGLNIGGFYQYVFIVNPTGYILTIDEAILIGFILAIIFALLVFSLKGVVKSSSGAWMIFYVCLSYLVAYALIGMIYIISSDFLWKIPILGSISYITWFVMGVGFLPFVIIVSLYILGEEARAVLEEGYLKQGYSKEEARELSKKNKRR